MSNKCAIGNKKENSTCYPNSLIIEYITDVLKLTPKSNIEENIEIINKHLNVSSSLEWRKKDKFFNKVSDKYLLPQARWTENNRFLSNLDIKNIMKQFENYYLKDQKHINNISFKYLGDYDLDFDGELTKFKMKWKASVDNNIAYNFVLLSAWGNKTQLYKHWVCLFIDNLKRIIIFYDSCVKPKILLTMGVVIPRLYDRGNTSNFTPYQFVYTLKKTQFDYENCGIFCVHLLSTLLASDNKDKVKVFYDFIQDLISKKEKLGNDKYYEYINSLRDKYFII